MELGYGCIKLATAGDGVGLPLRCSVFSSPPAYERFLVAVPNHRDTAVRLPYLYAVVPGSPGGLVSLPGLEFVVTTNERHHNNSSKNTTKYVGRKGKKKNTKTKTKKKRPRLVPGTFYQGFDTVTAVSASTCNARDVA